MFVPSAEQQAVVDAVSSGKNVVVDAVAGSGKTTTVLAIAKACTGKKIVQITFNSQLKSEVRCKVAEAGLDNVLVHTYHSIATTYYDKSAFTDAKIMQVINSDMSMRVIATGADIDAKNVDIVIIDEAQDMTMLYYRLVNKFIKDSVGSLDNVQLVILGDRYQGVYEFMKADTRFLTLADQIWNREFSHLTLNESYRVTKQIAWFVNNVMLGSERIIAKKDGCKVEWYVTNAFDLKDQFLSQLVNDIKHGVYKADDIFVLTASLKGANSPAKKIENVFVENKIPVFVPISEEGRMDEDVTRGKVVFSTLPSSKGRERSIVILLGFDENYFNFYAKTALKDCCPATLYVAVTRAKDRLIIVGDKRANHLPFIKFSSKSPDFVKNVSFFNHGKLLGNSAGQADNFDTERRTSVTDMVKFLKQETIEFLSPIIESMFVTVVDKGDQGNITAIPCKIPTVKNMFEDVSDLNGLTIPAIWETKMKMDASIQSIASCTQPPVMRSSNLQCTIFRLLVNSNQNSRNPFIQTAMKKVVMPCKVPSDFLYMVNVYIGMTEGYHGRIAQIKQYNWLTDAMVNACITHLESNVSKEGIEFETPILVEEQTIYGRVRISGCMDIVDRDTVWEVKCVDNLQLENMIQLIIYYWMFHKKNVDKDKTFKLINIRTGEIKELIADTFNVQKIMDALFAHKYKVVERLDDVELVRHCAVGRQGQDACI